MDRSETARGLPPIGELVRRQFRLILATVMLLLGLAGLYAFTLPLTYTATAVALLSPAPGNPLTPEAASGSAVQMTVALETEAQLLRTPAVADVVEAQLNREMPGPGEILSVSVPSNTQMLEISFTSGTPAGAQEGAQAFAEGYLEYREGRARSLQDARIERLEEQIEEAEANLRRALSEASDDGSSAYASQEVPLFVDRIAQLNNSLSAAEAVSTSPGSVISGAQLPGNSNELSPWLILIAAGVVGLAAGLGLAYVREWRRDLLQGSVSIEMSGIPLLATITEFDDAEYVIGEGGSDYESYRQLRTAVIASDPRGQVLAVVELPSETDIRGPGTSVGVAVNLAVALSEAQFSVLLIATAGHGGAIESLLGVNAGPGLAEAVRGGAPAQDLVVKVRGIALLRSGVDISGMSDLTASSAFRTVVSEFRADYDYVILAASTESDGNAALLAVDSTVLVLTPNETTHGTLVGTLDRLHQLGVPTLGAVLTDRTRRSDADRTTSERQRAKFRKTGGRV